MKTDIEQIGELIYAPNPNYPYPFEVERPPHYWMTEQTGRLAAAIEAYFDGETLTPAMLDLIKQYLRQYVERAVLTGDANRPQLVQQIDTLRTRRDIENYSEDLGGFGIEPF